MIDPELDWLPMAGGLAALLLAGGVAGFAFTAVILDPACPLVCLAR